MKRFPVRVGLFIATALGAGCAITPNAGSSNAQFQARQGTYSLEREDFESARPRLTWLASRCEAGAQGPRAMLLLAAAELDPGNAAGSPHAAAALAERYLELPGTPSDGRVLARTIYRVAAELGGLDPADGDEATAYPPLATHFERCDAPVSDDLARPLPSLPREAKAAQPLAVTPVAEVGTLQAQVETLEAQVAARADSLQELRGGRAALSARVRDLEAEIQRITELLTSGSARQGSARSP